MEIGFVKEEGVEPVDAAFVAEKKTGQVSVMWFGDGREWSGGLRLAQIVQRRYPLIRRLLNMLVHHTQLARLATAASALENRRGSQLAVRGCRATEHLGETLRDQGGG